MTADDILTLSDDGDEGCIVECDMEYPPHLHEMHNDYPLAPQTMVVDREMLSPYQQDIITKLKSSGLQAPKLVPNLMKKER